MAYKLNITLVISSAFLLGGCVSMSTMMVNQEGKWVRCQATGAGWLGAPMAASNHSRCVDDLQKIGYVPLSEASLGVKLIDWASSPAKIESVLTGSPAANAGLKQGDIIREVDGQPINKGIDVYKIIADKKPGDPLRIKVDRDGTTFVTGSTLAPRN